VAFRRRAVVLYNQARDRIAIVNADFQESLSGVRESQAFVHEGLTGARFHRLGRAYLDSRVAAQRLVAVYFPWVQFLSGVASVIVLGAGATMIHQGQLTTGALIAFVLYIDLFFTPIQQLSQVFDSWQQTTISVARIGELMRTETLTPNPDHPRPLGQVAGVISTAESTIENLSMPLAGVLLAATGIRAGALVLAAAAVAAGTGCLLK